MDNIWALCINLHSFILPRLESLKNIPDASFSRKESVLVDYLTLFCQICRSSFLVNGWLTRNWRIKVCCCLVRHSVFLITQHYSHYRDSKNFQGIHSHPIQLHHSALMLPCVACFQSLQNLFKPFHVTFLFLYTFLFTVGVGVHFFYCLSNTLDLLWQQ